MPDYTPIVADMMAKYTVRVRRWRTSMSGCAWQVYYTDGRQNNWIESPRPRTPISLSIFLHEIGHHAIGFGVYRRRCEEEYHAWRWAIDRMTELGIPVDGKVRRRYEASMRYAVAKALRRGMRELPEPLIEFLPAGYSVAA